MYAEAGDEDCRSTVPGIAWAGGMRILRMVPRCTFILGVLIPYPDDNKNGKFSVRRAFFLTVKAYGGVPGFDGIA